MEWESMERCHFSGSEESLGHLVEGEIFSNPLDINADLSTAEATAIRATSWEWDRLNSNFFLVLNGRQFRPHKDRGKLQLPSRAVYITGNNRSQCSMGGNVALPVGFKFEFRGSVLLH
jgi:hypothetical protein